MGFDCPVQGAAQGPSRGVFRACLADRYRLACRHGEIRSACVGHLMSAWLIGAGVGLAAARFVRGSARRLIIEDVGVRADVASRIFLPVGCGT